MSPFGMNVQGEGEDRIARVRGWIARLASAGADTSVGEQLVATMTAVLENMRANRKLSANLASKLAQ